MSNPRQARVTKGRGSPIPRTRDVRWWVLTLGAGLAAYIASSHGLFLYGGVWQIPIFVGCVAGLMAATPLQAAASAPLVLAPSLLLLPPLAVAQTGPVEYVAAVAAGAGAAAGVSYARTRLEGPRTGRATVVLAALLVGWTVVALWTPLLAAGSPPAAYGSLKASVLSEVPQPGAYVYDDQLYSRVFHLMHRGEPFYDAYRDAWAGLQGRPPLPNSVVGFRLPTFFWAWGMLPPDPFSRVYLFLVVTSIGVAASALSAGQLAGARFAPLAAVALAAYVYGTGISVEVLYVDLPAACIALAGVALLVRARVTGRRSALWTAAAVILVAALTREILAYLLALAALSSLLAPRGRRLAEALPWLVALGVFALAYGVHAVVVLPYLSGSASPISYLQGSPAFVGDALTRFADGFNGGGLVLAAAWALGALGAVAAGRRAGRPFAAFALAAIVLPMVAMLFVGNPGVDGLGAHFNYWGLLTVPLALALWPVSALLLGLEPT